MSTNLSRDSIFLAEDDEDDRFLFRQAFEEIGLDMDLIIASNGVELMDMLTNDAPPTPKLIFLDLNMPFKSGLECLAEIRANEELKMIPVIILSTSSDHKSIEQVFQDGANYYLCKPNNYPRLKRAIERVLSIDLANDTLNRSRKNFILF